MPDEVRQNAEHPLIAGFINYLFAVARGAQEATGPQQAQMMTGQPTWEVGSRRDLTDRSRLRETGEQKPVSGSAR